MNGLALCEAFYREYGIAMLQEQFPQLIPLVAVGLLGSGSECFGYDDDLSQDHDFEPGFCLLLPGEEQVDRRTAFALERAYAKLPREFMGVRRSAVTPVGGNRRGVLRTAEFFREKVGSADGRLTLSQWLSLPEQALAEATNGALFWDGSGEVSAIRTRLHYLPPAVRQKKLAGNLLLMAQSGQYNYPRCLQRGETGAAQLAVVEFVQSTLAVSFLLNSRYLPYYKWRFRGLRELPLLNGLAPILEDLLTTPNHPAQGAQKVAAMEDIAARVIALLQQQELTRASCGDLEQHAYSVNDSIADSAVRQLHIISV